MAPINVVNQVPWFGTALFLANKYCKMKPLVQRSPNFPAIRSCLWAVIPLFLALVLFHLAPGLMAQTEPPQILFLHLRLTNGTIVLLSTNVQPGMVKAQRHRTYHHALHYEVRSVSGLTTWKAALDHPQWHYLEYPDPENPGRLRRQEVRRDTLDFMIRIPWQAEAEKVEFYELAESGPAKASRKILASIDLKARSQ